MSTTSKNNLSSFGQAAVTLDRAFAEFARLAGELDRVSIESESGLERARKLLAHIGEAGSGIEDGMKALVDALNQARETNDAITAQIAAKTGEIQERQESNNRLFQRFKTLSDMSKQITASVSAVSAADGGVLSREQKDLLMNSFPQIDERMTAIVGEAKNLMDDARLAKVKSLEREADSLRQSLQSAQKKLSALAMPESGLH